MTDAKKRGKTMKKILFLAAMLLLFAFKAGAAAMGTDLLQGIKPGADGKIDVMTILPHEDDETIFVGGTIMKMKKDPRVRVHILCLTLGDMSGTNKILNITPELQGKIRSRELRSAAAVIGADEVIQFDYHDQGLTPADQDVLRKKILDEIEKAGAEVVIGYGPDGVTGHPDHKTGSAAATDAFKKSHAQRLYYICLPNFAASVFKMTTGMRTMKPTYQIDIRPYRKMKMLAMDEHATQKFFAGFGQHFTMLNWFDYEYFTLGAENK
jgi:N-acetylglucosamine malate deacetylase 2